jgi:hypothetical protein
MEHASKQHLAPVGSRQQRRGWPVAYLLPRLVLVHGREPPKIESYIQESHTIVRFYLELTHAQRWRPIA